MPAPDGIAKKRLFAEYKALALNPVPGILAFPPKDVVDLFHWECWINGPSGTPFEGGCFCAHLKFPQDYPLSPPTMKFVACGDEELSRPGDCGGVYHPNGKSLPSPYARHGARLCLKSFVLILAVN